MYAGTLKTVDDWYGEWVKHRGDTVAESRVRSDIARYARYIGPRFGTVEIASVTPKKIANWVDALKADGVGEFTISVCILIFRQIFDNAVDAGARRANPLDGVQIESASGIRKREATEILSADEFERLVSAFTPHFRPLVLLAGLLGVSWAECIGLKVSDIDFGGKRITVGRLLAVETNGRVQYREGKARSLDMSDRLTSSLATYILTTQESRDKAEQPWVFLSPRVPKHPLRPNFNKFYLRPALQDAGLDPRSLTFHSLRHTAAAQMLLGGLPVEEVARILGHSTVVTTRRYYEDFIPKPVPKPDAGRPLASSH